MSIITTRPDGKKEIMIGIDLGTTNSAVAIYDNGEPKIYENLLGRRTTPSVIALKKTRNKATKEITEEWIVGEAAKNQAAANHLNTFYGVKRLIGRRFDDPEVAKMQALASYKIVAGPNGDAWVEVNGKAKAPAEISAMVLRELRTAVIKTLGLEEDDKNGNLVVNAVITVPAYFNDAQRQATKDAGKIAALDVKRIVNEPTSAALAYGMDKQKDCKIAVFDLGGGTFDVSILSVDVSDAGNTIEVLATNGDTFLGGENFDEIVTEHLVEALNEEHGTDIDLKDKASKDKHAQAIQRLREGAERAKIALSIQDSSTINIPFLMKDAVGEDVNFEYTLTRKQLENLLKPLIEKTLKPCENALADAGKKLRGENAPPLKPTELDEIILVGGQTRMPLVIDTVKKYFGKDPKRDVNPDEIVAMGAAAQGAVLQGKIDNVLLLDVIPLSIGIRGFGDVMNIVVPRNASIPGSFKDEYGNPEKNAPGIRIQVYQGERPKASDNKKLGEFILGSLDPRSPDRLPPADVGKLKIEVSFNIDADGVLNVSARIPETGREAKITLKANGGLSEQEVARMLQEAEANAEKDKLFRLSLVAKPNAEAALADAEADAIQDDKGEFVMEYFRTAPEELKKEFFETVKELTAAKDRNDVVVMTEKTELLNSVRARIGEAFNNAAKPSAETPAADTPTPDASPEAPAKDAPKGPQP